MFPLYAVRACTGNRGIAAHILSHGDWRRRVVNYAPWPLYPRERTAVSIGEKSGWAPKPVWTVWRGEKCVAVSLIRAPDRPARMIVTLLTTLRRKSRPTVVSRILRFSKDMVTQFL